MPCRRIVLHDVFRESAQHGQVVAVLSRHASPGMGDLHPGGTSAGQYLSYEQFRISAIESAASDMNHNRKILLSGGRDHFRDLTAFSRVSNIYGGSREMQLQSDQLLTSTPV